MKKADTNRAMAAKPRRMLRNASMKPLDALAGLVGHLGAGDGLDAVGEDRLDAGRELGGVDAVCGGDVDRVDLDRRRRTPGGDVDVEGGQPGAEEVVGLAEGEDADDLHLGLRAVGEQHGRAISDAEAVVLGGAAVDGDLAQAVWGATAVEGGTGAARPRGPRRRRGTARPWW